MLMMIEKNVFPCSICVFVVIERWFHEFYQVINFMHWFMSFLSG